MEPLIVLLRAAAEYLDSQGKPDFALACRIAAEKLQPKPHDADPSAR